MKSDDQMRRHSDFQPIAKLYPRLPPKSSSYVFRDTGNEETSRKASKPAQVHLPPRVNSMGNQGKETLQSMRTHSDDVKASNGGIDDILEIDNSCTANAVKSAEWTFNSTRQKTEAHRNKRWQQKLCTAAESTKDEPEVTSPSTARNIHSSFTSEAVERCVKDQHRRNKDRIPPHVEVDKSNSSVCDDDDITYWSRGSSVPIMAKNAPSINANRGGSSSTPAPREEIGSEPEPRRPRRSSYSSTGDSSVPSFLDKTYLKNLAARHRSSVCGTIASRSTGSNREGDQTDNGGRSSVPLVTPPESPSCQPRRPSYQSTTSRERQSPAQPSSARAIVPPQSSPPQPQQQVIVTICPGVSAPLRGSDEIRKAVANQFYITNVHCFGCASDICCIADVQYAICPHCRVISSLEDYTFEGEMLSYRWGLGIGFTQENLWDMQAEIAAASFVD
jgi:hypothetical protein